MLDVECEGRFSVDLWRMLGIGPDQGCPIERYTLNRLGGLFIASTVLYLSLFVGVAALLSCAIS